MEVAGKIHVLGLAGSGNILARNSVFVVLKKGFCRDFHARKCVPSARLCDTVKAFSEAPMMKKLLLALLSLFALIGILIVVLVLTHRLPAGYMTTR